MERKKFYWWLLILPVLLAACILTAVFWDALIIRVAPKAVLTSALTRVFTQLEERFQEDPLRILANSIDPKGQYTADIRLETSNDILGPVTYDMTVQTDAASHRLYAEGIANTSGKNLNLSLYLDEDFMAVSSNDFTQGKFYGITYDTFTEDVRSIPSLKYVITDRMLAQWNDSVQSIQKHMHRSYTLPQMPELSAKDLQKILLGVLALPCEVEGRSVSVDREVLDCQALSYSASGAQVERLLSDTPYAKDAKITVTFYLFQDSLVKIRLDCISGENCVLYDLLLGNDPASGTLRLQYTQNCDGEYKDSVVTVATAASEEHYSESWTVQKNIGKTVSVSFDWKPSSGDMNLMVNDAAEPIFFNLTETDNGFKVTTHNPSGLMQMFLEEETGNQFSKMTFCGMTVSKGAHFEVPTYKNLDQWALDDLLILLQSVGALIGINFTLS